MKRLALFGAPVAALLLSVGVVPATAPAAAGAPVADRAEAANVKVWSKDGVLKRCSGHAYRYAVDVPAGDSWSLELRLVNRRGRAVSFGYEVTGGDPKVGHGRFLFCSDDLRPGRYKVTAKLIWSHYSHQYAERAKPRAIQLRRP